ncbi:MAG: hypothetical protein ABI132_07625 [Rhodanobacteraceae bacterium]
MLTSSPITKLRSNETPAHRAALDRVHDFFADLMAALSTHGVVRPVPDSDHTIQLSQPDAVNNAILEVLGEVAKHK